MNNRVRNFFVLLSDILSALIVLLSLFIALFVAIKTKDVILPPSPTVGYNSMLLERYITAEDWTLIHYIEDIIDFQDLDKSSYQAYIVRYDYNYYKNPEEYIGQALPIEIYQSLETKCLNILLNREQYRLTEPLIEQIPFIFYRGTYEYDREVLVPMLDEISRYADQASTRIRSGDTEEAQKAQKALDKAWGVYKDTQYNGGIFYYSPEYKPIVYECFDRPTHYDLQGDYLEFPISSEEKNQRVLLDVAREILLDHREDLGLRLRALFYLGTFTENENRKLFIDDLYQILEDIESGKNVVENDKYNSEDRAGFERIVLQILKSEVYKEKYFQIQQAAGEGR